MLLNERIFDFLVLVQCFGIKLIFGANILILESLPSPSHHLFFRTVAKSLAADGHNVTSINSDGDGDRIENVHNIVLEKMHEHLYGSNDEVNILDYGKIHPWLFPIIMQSWSIKMSEGALISAGFDQLLNYPNDFQFDLIIYDYDSAPYLIGFLHKFNCPPMIGMSAYSVVFVASPALGSSFSTYIPYHAITDFENETSFLWRVNNFLLYFVDIAIYDWYVVPKIDRMLRSKFPNMPYIGDLEQRAELVLINNHPAIQRSEPMLSNMIRIGGAHILPPNPLPEHLNKIFLSGRDVILMSLGTNIKSSMLGVNRITEIIETFRSLSQYTFIWKFEATDVEQMQIAVPENVKLEKWLPQNDILAQPSLKLFITHAGLLSTQEAVWHGVPMIGIPAFLDQYINIEECARSGIAEIVEIQSINRESFKNTILKIMETPSYRHNARIKSNNFRDEKDAPLERAIWWINYIIRNGNATFMSSPVKGFNVYQRHSIDIVAFLTVITIILYAIFYYIFKHIIKCLSKRIFRKKSKAKRE